MRIEAYARVAAAAGRDGPGALARPCDGNRADVRSERRAARSAVEWCVRVMRTSRWVPVVAFALAACGRTDLGGDFGDDGFGDDDGLGDDGRDDAPGGPGAGRPVDGGRDDGDLPPPVPEPDESGCGNGEAAPGELCYLPQIRFWSRIDPCSIDVGDVDGDGHMDVAVPNSDFDHLESPENFASVLYGDGFGGLSEPYGFLAGGDFPVGVAIGDLDLDGRQDLVVANSDTSAINAMLAVDVRAFGPPLGAAGGTGPVTAALGDLDADGLLDVVVTGSESGDVSMGRGRGDGTFGELRVLDDGFGFPWDAELFDLDGDGDLDIAASDNGASIVALWRNDGSGVFGRMNDLGVGWAPVGITAADVDADGDLDLLVASSIATHVRLNDGSGGFTLAEDIYAGVGPRAIATGDFDNDGRLDAAILANGSTDITIAVGNGAGGFTPAAQYPVGTNVSGIGAADFNEDGVLDFAVSNQWDNDVGLVLSWP